MLDFLFENWIDITFFVLGALCFFVTFTRTGSLKKSVENLSEVFEMKKKYKTVDTVKAKEQSFSEEVKDYILDPVTNELEEKPIPKNVQDYIQSFIECALERALQRFLPENVIEDNSVSDYTQKVDDLSSIGAAMEIAEDYRDKYNLPDNYSISDIYAFVDKQAKDIKDKLIKREEKDNEGKEKTPVEKV